MVRPMHRMSAAANCPALPCALVDKGSGPSMTRRRIELLCSGVGIADGRAGFVCCQQAIGFADGSTSQGQTCVARKQFCRHRITWIT